MSETSTETPTTARRNPLVVVLVAVIAVAALAGAVALGHVWGNDSGPGTPSAGSVDAGFARDMSTHHQQAITMAGYTRDHADRADVELLARDIETGQLFQVGQMQGWLDSWGLSRQSSAEPMAWMGGMPHSSMSGMSGMDHNGETATSGLMPGMATPAEMTKLQTLTGKALDVYFLQLMIRHHQGGLPMAEYAIDHATQPQVVTLAKSMYAAQSSEIVTMEQMLRSLGGSPLPPPGS